MYGSPVWQSELTQCLEEVASLGIADPPECARLHEKLAAGVFTLVVAGQFKRGKSSLINAMLGQNVLPVGVVPLTSIVTVLRYGNPPTASVQFESGEIHSVDLNIIADYVTEKGNPNNIKSVRMVFVDYPSAWLRDGIQIVDTPGIDSVFKHNTDLTYAYMPQADGVLFVASVDQPLSRRELDFLTEIREHANKIFCILNKSDYLNTHELEESIEFSSRVLCETLGQTVSVFPVSAKLALEGKLSSHVDAGIRNGFTDLEEALRTFLKTEKVDVWRHSIQRNLLSILSRVRLKIQLELRALSAPLEQSEAALGFIEQRKTEILAQWAEYEILLSNDVENLFINDIEPGLKQFKDNLKETLLINIGEWYASVQGHRLNALEQELDSRIIAHIRSAYDVWRGSQDRLSNSKFEAIALKYWSRLQTIIDDSINHAAKLLFIPYQAVNAQLLWRAESNFYYKFWDEPPSLLLLKSLLVRAMPRFIGGPIILRQLRQRALELIETQAGRVRHDLGERLNGNLQSFRLLMNNRVESAADEIESAIRKGVELNQKSKSAINARKEALVALDNQSAELQKRIESVQIIAPKAANARVQTP